MRSCVVTGGCLAGRLPVRAARGPILTMCAGPRMCRTVPLVLQRRSASRGNS